MKIRFLTSVAGAYFAYHFNEVVDLRDDLAREFIRCKQAEPYVEPVETATRTAPQNMMRRVGNAIRPHR